MDVTELDVIGEPRNGPVQQLLKPRERPPRPCRRSSSVCSKFIGGDDDMKRLARRRARCGA